MKNIFCPILVLFALVQLLSSCNKKLDVTPPQYLPPGIVLSTSDNVIKALNGAYDAISYSSALGGDMQLYSELLAANGEIFWDGTYNQPDEIFQKAILTNNSFVASTWAGAYSANNICNNILNAIGVVDADAQDRVKGEALFLKGLLYFELVTLYAKPYSDGNANTNLGLQIVSQPTRDNISDANYTPRSTVAATYDTIINELTQAQQLLPESNGVYATKYAAAAILSRVYLQMGDYQKALDAANAVIASGKYALTDTYAEEFNNSANTTEDIFAIQVSALDGYNDMQLFWSTTEDGARDGDVDVEQEHIDLYEDGDARKDFFYIDADDVYRSGKWKLLNKNLSIIRLAELYLTRAECNFRLGTSAGATPFADIKTIRSRAGLSTAQSYITLDNILLERKLELAHEGQAIQDVKRLKETVDGFDYDANELVLPIPLREVNAANGALVQNDGY